MSSYRSTQVNSVEILGGEAWLRAFINIAMFIKGVISSVKFWCMFLVSELQVWLVSFPSPAHALLFLSLSFSPIIPSCSPEVLGTFRNPRLTLWMPFPFLTFSYLSLSPYSFVHIFPSSVPSMCYDLPFLSTVSSSAQSCPKQVLMWTFPPPPPSKFLPSMSSFMPHLILCLKGFVLVEALSTFRYTGR